MDTAHLHMLTNHIPIIGTAFAILVLISGMLGKNKQVRNVGYFLMVISAIGGLIALYTGEAAEELVEGMQGVSDQTIEEHEEAGELAMGFLYATGIVALLALYFEKIEKFQKIISFIVLLSGLGLFLTAAHAGYHGGMIRHTELHAAPASGDAGGLEQNHEHETEYEAE